MQLTMFVTEKGGLLYAARRWLPTLEFYSTHAGRDRARSLKAAKTRPRVGRKSAVSHFLGLRWLGLRCLGFRFDDRFGRAAEGGFALWRLHQFPGFAVLFE